MRVLVTGGSGFLGINLIRHLLARDCRVRNLDLLPFDYPEVSAIESVQGDIRDRATVDRCMEGVEAVVHCAAALPLYKRGGDLQHRHRGHAQRRGEREGA